MVITPGEELTVGKLAEVVANPDMQVAVEDIIVTKAMERAGDYLIVSSLLIIRRIKEEFPDTELHLLGETDVMVEVAENPANRRTNPPWILVGGVCIILFFGAALAIMNFHADVSMPEVHRYLYFLITGQKNIHPYVMQIPYSIGIGLGMVIFFNHVTKRKFSKEPSPLEVEMFLYQQNIHEYMLRSAEQEAKERAAEKRKARKNS